MKKKIGKGKIVLIVVVVLLIIGLLVPKKEEPEPTKDEAVEPVEKVQEELEKEPEVTEEPVGESLPGIAGSQAYDVILSLEKNGIPKAEAADTEDGFQYDSMTADYSYSITANRDHEIMSATFMVLTGEDTEGFLQYCASMPYDTADPGASEWVTANLGTEATATFGDAVFTLSTGTQGPILKIEAPDFEEYVLNKAS